MLKKLVMTALVITVLCQQAVASVVMLGAALESVTPVTAEMPACHSSQQSAHSGGAELQAFAQAGRLASGALNRSTLNSYALNSNTLKSIAPKINAHNGGGHPAGDHSCCKLKCSCCLMGCHAVFMAFHWSQAEMPSVYFLSSSFQSLAEHHPVSLYRPPIFA